jgi:hypothetical protein
MAETMLVGCLLSLTDGSEVALGGRIEGLDDVENSLNDGGVALLNGLDAALDRGDLGDSGAGKAGESEDVGELHLD